MVVIKCPVNGCVYETPDESSDIVCALLNLHSTEHRQPVNTSQHTSNVPKLNRPCIDIGIDPEAWMSFVRRWETFKIGSGIPDGAASIQLFQCASEKLGDLMIKADPKLLLKPVEDVLESMESIAVIKVALGTRRAELMKFTQGHDEAFRTFAARVRGKAETCDFFTLSKCVCKVQ